MCVIVFYYYLSVFLSNLRGNLLSLGDGIFCSGWNVFVANALLFVWRLLYHVFFLVCESYMWYSSVYMITQAQLQINPLT